MNATDLLENKKTINSHILIEGARVHNLKNISVSIPRNKLVVITGLSGSGKSSLAFDTLYAEGQRRYVESLSSYARQFMGRLNKPDVDNIKGISPAIAIEQKVISRNPRSTVGTVTEIYDYLKLLFARIGKTYSPVSGKEVKRETVADVINYLKEFPENTKALILSPLNDLNNDNYKQKLNVLQQQGFSKLYIQPEVIEIDELIKQKYNPKNKYYIVIDRITCAHTEENLSRIADSAEIAFRQSNGDCSVIIFKNNKPVQENFNNRFELDGITFEDPDINFFTFNNPVGACKTCEGYGSVIGIDESLVMPNKNLSVYNDAIACWRGETMSEWKEALLKHAHKFDFPVHKPIKDLKKEHLTLLWTGNKYFHGLNDFFKYLEANLNKIQYRVMLSRYRGKTTCPDCYGTRLRKDAQYVKIAEKNISELVLMPIDELAIFFNHLKLNKNQLQTAQRVLTEIKNRLKYLQDVGLGYLTLNRQSNTLSGGESQRINLATSLGSSLVGSMYILDEPSIGLHPRDTQRLIGVLKSLRNLGNTVIVVEHDEEVMRAADYIIDMGPMAGSLGGEVVFAGNHEQLINHSNSITAQYLTGKQKIEIPAVRRKCKDFIELKGVRENNLKNIDVKIPLDVLTVVTGVSGSGKSSLVKNVLFPSLVKHCGGYGERAGEFDELKGALNRIQAVEFVDQNPIGKSTRSNPVTYIKAFDEIRNLFASLPQAKVRGYKPSHFSFNVDGGRCEVCEGEGIITVEMQFMADVHLICDTCKGKRYKEDILEIEYQGKNIYDILCMTIDDAINFFTSHTATTHSIENKIVARLKLLQQVGLGYVTLGQSSSTLSGGEAQRIKLAAFLGQEKEQNRTFFIFDEPTTGLHFHDVKKLLYAIHALIDKGHTVLIIEHHTDVIKCADWVIDLGPEAGENGGQIVFEGTPEDLAKCNHSHTGKYLRF
jgi:excinuclease ABC subunit A